MKIAVVSKGFALQDAAVSLRAISIELLLRRGFDNKCHLNLARLVVWLSRKRVEPVGKGIEQQFI